MCKCQIVCESSHVHLNCFWSVIPMQCVHRWVHEVTVDNTAENGGSKYFESRKMKAQMY